jgi:glutaredoxin
MRTFILTIVITLMAGQVTFGQTKKLDSLSEENTKTNKIIVYGSDTCHFCIDTKAYLKEKNIEFTYYDVDINLLKQREMLIKLQNAGISVESLSLPVVDLQGKLIMNSNNFDGFLKKLTASKNK